MRAVAVKESGAAPEIVEIPVPAPGPGEVLVKMEATPINPSDLAFVSGNYEIKKPFPAVPGFEGCGTVVAAGKGLLPKLWLGKKVSCAASPMHNGSWAEYMVTGAAMCVPLPGNITFDQGSMLFVNPLTAMAFFDIHKKFARKQGSSLAIVNTAAASALGQMIVKMGKRKGIKVISIVRRKDQVDLLRSIGAEYVLDSSSKGFEKELEELSNKLNAKLIFDAVGGEMSPRLLKAVPNGSKLVIYARLSGNNSEFDPADVIFTGKQVEGFWLTGWLHQKSMLQSMALILKTRSMIARELSSPVHKKFRIEDFAEAIETYKNNMSLGKVLLGF